MRKKLSHYELYQKNLREKGLRWNNRLDARGVRLALTDEEKAEKRSERGPIKGKTNFNVFR